MKLFFLAIIILIGWLERHDGDSQFRFPRLALAPPPHFIVSASLISFGFESAWESVIYHVTHDICYAATTSMSARQGLLLLFELR